MRSLVSGDFGIYSEQSMRKIWEYKNLRGLRITIELGGLQNYQTTGYRKKRRGWEFIEAEVTTNWRSAINSANRIYIKFYNEVNKKNENTN